MKKNSFSSEARHFPRLFEPGQVGTLALKNRLVKAPMASRLAGLDGAVTERMITYYRQLARGGVGLVVVEFAYIDDLSSDAIDNQLGASNNGHIPGLQWLASSIKENGARAALQIVHCGRQRMSLKAPMKAPSPIAWEELAARGASPPEELTPAEIQTIVEAFGEAALRAKRSGFDMVEIHGAHGYLITNFLAPFTNKRTDRYGGDLNNRMRFLLEVIANVREKVGPEYPLGVRLVGTDYQEEGIPIEDTKKVAAEIERAGVDAIHISGGDHDTMDQQVIPSYWPTGYNVWAAAEIKKVVNIPVFASGAITTPELAESILADGKADFISLGRPLLADPFFPMKAQQGRPEDIAPCIRCNCCFSQGIRVGALRCAVNAAAGREAELTITPAENPKKVAVIGGGPGGMEAAMVARLRGHQVTLFEKRRLGGMLIEGSIPDFKVDLRRLIDYLATQVKKLGVNLIMTEATLQTIKDGKFDAVIVAVGGATAPPDVPGADRPLVREALEVLNGASVGATVVVFGGGLVGSETGLFLAEQGKKVHIVTRQDQIALELERGARRGLLRRLKRCAPPVEQYCNVTYREIADDGVMIVDRDGKRRELKAETVVLAQGLEPDNRLQAQLSELPGLEVYAVGDCVKPRLIYDAIQEGYLSALLKV